MSQTIKRPSVAQPRLYHALRTPLCHSKCIPRDESAPCPYLHAGPTEHLRREYHECRSNPLEIHQGIFDRAAEFRLRERRKNGFFYHPGTGLCMCNDPSSILNAWARDEPYGQYTQGLPALPGRPWPQWDAWVSPHCRGRGKYYGWYYPTEEYLRNQGPADGASSDQQQQPGALDQSQQVPSAAPPPEGEKLHRELLQIQRPSCKPDTGYGSRWGFHQP